MTEERSGRDIRASGAEIERHLHGFDGPLPPAVARARAESLAASLVQFYGGAIEHILDIVDESAVNATAVFARLCDDPFVSGLLAVHGLHPLTAEERVERALARVRPYIESHQGNVEILSVEGSTVRLRMSGSCHGCPSSAATLKLAIERAIFDACPEIDNVSAEGVETSAAPSSLQLVSDWFDIALFPELRFGGCATLDVLGTAVMFVRANGTLFAYRNHCPACLLDLGDPALDGGILACGRCGTAYDAVRAGRESGDGTRALEPYPLLVEDERVQLTIPVGV